MEIVFVRHGQPEWIKEGRPQMDPALTELGRVQSERVSQRLAARGASMVWMSPALRTRQTAEPFCTRAKLEPEVVDDLLELKLPDWSASPPEAIAETFISARKRPLAAWKDGLPGGENFGSFESRVRAALEKQLATLGVVRHANEPDHAVFDVPEGLGRVVVFGHGGTNSVALTVLLGLPSVPWEWERFMLHHTGIIRLKAVPVGPAHIFSVRSFNDCEHLEKHHRSA